MKTFMVAALFLSLSATAFAGPAKHLSNESLALISALTASDPQGKPVLNQLEELMKHGNAITDITYSPVNDYIGNYAIIVSSVSFNSPTQLKAILHLDADEQDTPADGALVYKTRLEYLK